MILKKRYKRDIKHNLSLYVSSTLLTVLSLLLFYLYSIAGNGILDFGNKFGESQRIEDANFSTYLEIPDDQIKIYEDKYDMELEKQHYINIETDGITARVFQRSEKIDLYDVTKGKDVSNDNEIVISEGYAQTNDVLIGDSLKIKDKEYTVSGFIERPDYLYMLENPTDANKNVKSFYICYMTDNEFESLGETNCQYLTRYNKDNNKDFRKEINEEYRLSSYLSAEDNVRIQMVTEQAKVFIQMAYMILFTLPLMAVLLISVILSRKIKSEQKMIGTLSAFGYTNRQIIIHYAGFSALPGIIGGVLTTIVIAFTAEQYGALGLMDYEPMQAEFKMSLVEVIIGIIVPTVMYIISTIFTVRKLLKHDVTELLAGLVKGKNKVRRFLVGKKVSFRTKFSVRSIIGNPGRTFVLFLGVFLGTFVILLAFCCYDTWDHMSENVADNMGNYNYQYVLNELSTENPYGGETILVAAVEDEEANKVSLMGADGVDLLALKDMDGAKVDVNDDYVVTSLYAYVTGVQAGDKITVVNPLSMEEYQIEIDNVVKNDFVKAVYTSRENVSKIAGLDANFYNMILSKDKLDIPENKIVSLMNRNTIDEQYSVLLKQMDVIVYSFAGVGIVLCIVAVYIAVNMVVTENRTNISMLRVLGYNDAKIRKLLLKDNIYVAIIAVIVGIPSMIMVMNALFSSFIDILGYVIKVYVSPKTYVITILLVFISYFFSNALVSRKIAKIDMVESLKDNRE